MKSYTDIEQSKKLAEILPLDSADMFFSGCTYPKELHLPTFSKTSIKDNIPCWSLAALLDVLPSSTLDSSDDHHYRLHCMERFTEWYDNSIDACYKMILKLNELNLL